MAAVADIQFRYIFQRVILSFREDKCGKMKFKDGQDPVLWFQAWVDCYVEEASDVVLMLNRLSVSPVPYAIEFLCICCANLLVRLLFSLFARRRPLFFARSRIILIRLLNEWWILSVRGNCLVDVG